MRRTAYFLLQDVLIISVSVILALFLIDTHIVEKVISTTQDFKFVGSFIAGMFFTSVFTTAPAIVALGEISQQNGLIATAFFGALGSVLGDMLIFRFVEDRFSKHLMEMLKHQSVGKRFRALFKLPFFRYFTFLVGGMIIASPLPDEIGISILGFSKTKVSYFLAISLVFNFLGILIIGFVASAI